MLDRPETFDAAERLVSEFAELNAAHQAVVTAREQVSTLAPARDSHGQLRELILKQDQLKEVKAGVDGYKETCRLALLQERLARCMSNWQARERRGNSARLRWTTSAQPWMT